MALRYIGMLYLFFVAIIGIIFGNVYVQLLPHAAVSDAIEQWSILISMDNALHVSVERLSSYFIYQLQLIIVMIVFGLSFFGFPIVVLIHFFKAFLVGSTMQMFVIIFGNSALHYIMVWILPTYIIILTAYMLISSSFATYNYECIQIIKAKQWRLPLKQLYINIVFVIVLLVIASFTQFYVSPLLHQFLIQSI